MAKRKPIGIVLTGAKDLDNALRAFPPEVQKRLVTTATKTVAKGIKSTAQRIAPRKTGALAEAIRVTGLRSRGRRYGRTRFGASVTVGEKWFAGASFYGAFVEFGTGDRYQNKFGKFTGRIQEGAFSFLRRALYSHRSDARRAFGQALRDAITKYGQRRARAAAKAAAPFLAHLEGLVE